MTTWHLMQPDPRLAITAQDDGSGLCNGAFAQALFLSLAQRRCSR